jgi:hypothetical protein
MNNRSSSIVVVLMAALFCTAILVRAPFSGHNSKGDFGLQSGSATC